jgi:hypothetical protein
MQISSRTATGQACQRASSSSPTSPDQNPSRAEDPRHLGLEGIEDDTGRRDADLTRANQLPWAIRGLAQDSTSELTL